MGTAITAEMTADTGQQRVKQGKRVIGFITFFPSVKSIGRVEGWTFIPNRKDVADRYTVPSPVFDDPKAVLRDINERLA